MHTAPACLPLRARTCRSCGSDTTRNRCAAGAYEIAPAEKKDPEVSLFATGSEVAIAVEARKLLHERGVAARVVSVPCFELFSALPAPSGRKSWNAKVKVAVEAAVRQGWDEIIGSDGAFVGMTSFGASAPAKDLYKHFGITPQKVAEAALAKLGRA
jgi:Transketolase